MCTGFQVLKDTEKSGKALALPFCKRFLRKLSASGRWTNRKTIRQTLSNRFWKSRKVQHLFLHNLPEKKKMNNTWQYSFIKRIPPVMIRLPIEMRMNIPVHERIKILVIWKWWRRTGHAWWRQEGTKGIGQDYFEWSSFSTNPIGIHSKLPCHF